MSSTPELDRAAYLWKHIEDLRKQAKEAQDELRTLLIQGVSPNALSALTGASTDAISQRTTNARRAAGMPLNKQRGPNLRGKGRGK